MAIAASTNDYAEFAWLAYFGALITGFDCTHIRAAIACNDIVIVAIFTAIQNAIAAFARRQNPFACTASCQTFKAILYLTDTGAAIATVFIAIIALFTFIQTAIAAIRDINRRFAARIIACPAWLGRAHTRTAIARILVAIVAAFSGFDNTIAACAAAVWPVVMPLCGIAASCQRKHCNT